MNSTKDRKKAVREFGMVMAVVALLVAARLLWLVNSASLIALAIALFFLVGAWFLPSMIAPLEVWWMKLAEVLSKIMTVVLMTLLFFLVITPIGLALKIFKKKLLDLQPDPKLDSYWHDVVDAEPRYYKPF